MSNAKNLTNQNLKPFAPIVTLIPYLLLMGFSGVGIASILRLAASTTYFWIKRYLDLGSKGLERNKRGRPIGSGRLLDPEQEKIIQDIITKNPDPREHDLNSTSWKRKTIVELVKHEFGIDVSVTTIGNYLKRWGFTNQVCTKVAYQRDPLKIAKYILETFLDIYKRSKESNIPIYWSDEAGAHSESTKVKSYSPRGVTPVIHTTGSRLKTNIISAVANDGTMRYMVYDTSMNGKMFITFMQRLINTSETKIFLIVDNLRAHHSKLVQKWLKEHYDKIEVFYLPPYCPHLNPDEYLNHLIKQRLAAQPQARTKAEFTETVRKIMRGLQKDRGLMKRIFLNENIWYASGIKNLMEKAFRAFKKTTDNSK
jgi:transposase